MNTDFNWFQLSAIPANAIGGVYDLKIVALSYLIAVLASYVALDFVGRLRAEPKPMAKLYWLCGGAFAMGAGIWSMHFIGMLAFIMPMPMTYELNWTIGSLIVAVLVSGFALYLLRDVNRSFFYLVLGGIVMGLGIATMHYMGMTGMTGYVTIRYVPGLFFLSIAVAIFAAEAALWLALQSNRGSERRQFNLKIVSALIMGIAICGMHYTGMAAAVFIPIPNVDMPIATINPTLLAYFITGITLLVISLALTVSSSYKKMIEAVQNEKEFLNAMLDNLEDGIIACDPDGKITVFNTPLQTDSTKIPKNLNEQFELHYQEEGPTLTKEEFPLCLALNGQRIHDQELIMAFKNGTTKHVIIDGQPIISKTGQKLGAVIAIHDVTERKKNERIKNEFISVVSHELRTPLTSIRGSLGLLLAEKDEKFSEKSTKLLEIANKNCERLLLLINDILDMEKIQAGKMRFNFAPININQLVNDSVTANRMYGERFGIKLHTEELSKPAMINVDGDRMLQVLANLISNAVKFSVENGTVDIIVTEHGQSVRVSVSNKGHGIPLEFQSRIFQKFSQADSTSTRGKGGTGLGLSISKAIIEKMGGTIDFVSNPNETTTFYFDVPIYAVGTPENVIVPTGKSRKVLICENDQSQAGYLAALLHSIGIESDIANTVTEAKKLLTNQPYQALLLDLIFPDQDGITFIRELRNNSKTKSIPIIVLSVMAKTGKELLNGDALCVIDWLEKPINFSKLLDAMSQIKRQSKNAIPRILHIEDDPDAKHIMETLLKNEKVDVISASTIEDTKHCLASQSFDLVILDLLLPDGNGTSLLPLIAQYKIPVIVYSAYELDHEYAKFVKKLFVKSKNSNEELVLKIEELLNITNANQKDPTH